MSLLDSIYQEAILAHYKSPKNRGVLDPFDVKQDGVNPSCGDQITLYVRAEGGTVAAVTFEGEGCAISQAATSLMTEAVMGLPVEDALQLAEEFRQMLRGGEPGPSLGELALMQSVAKLPARVKCAMLPFVTLERALERLDNDQV